MTADEAIEQARRIARERDWAWLAPVEATRRRNWWVGKGRWHVWSNAGTRGMNVRVVIDDATGVVIEQAFLPR